MPAKLQVREYEAHTLSSVLIVSFHSCWEKAVDEMPDIKRWLFSFSMKTMQMFLGSLGTLSHSLSESCRMRIMKLIVSKSHWSCLEGDVATDA